MLFKNCDNGIEIKENFIYLADEEKASYVLKKLGEIENFENFAAVYREDVFFQKVRTGDNISEIPKETQWLLIKQKGEEYTVIIPLVLKPLRSALCGKDNALYIYSETGDEAIVENKGLIAYYRSGKNPYELIEKAAEDISKVLPECELKKNKRVPEFVNYFGWCTWDSFYEKVTSEDVKRGLESFKKGGTVPGLLILDDGWQSVEEVGKHRGEHKLKSFKANEKFNYNLHETVDMAKNDYDVKMFMVWHAIMGYWGGTYPYSEEMKEFDVKLKTQNHSKTMYEVNEEYSTNLHFPYGFVNPKKAFDFYNTYHSYLRKEGVDGVKVDVQSAVEGAGYGEGGRVETIKAFRKGLEASVNLNFNGNLINCMGCANDHILNYLTANVTRSSDDFYPSRPESHGIHVITNAFVSFFMSDFTMCDWDMFQTQHEYGKFHAASRAISGGPVYVSDRVDEHDFDVIEKLIVADSKLPLCKKNAKPTKDSLFFDAKEQNDIFKIFNYNGFGGVIGAFNTTTDKVMKKAVRVSDIDGFDMGEYAVYDSNVGKILKVGANDEMECELQPISFDLFTVSRIEKGFAPIGLTEKYNAGGTVTYCDINDDSVTLRVSDSGEFLAYSEKEPKRILVNDDVSEFEYSNGTLKIKLDKRQDNKIYINY